MKPTAYHSLQIKDISLHVHLGCSSEERSLTHEVRVTVDLRFPQAPSAVESDKLEDTLNYAKIIEAFQAHCKGREFALIEKLANDLMKIVRDFSGEKMQIALSAHKVSPPVRGLLGGVVYRLGDFN